MNIFYLDHEPSKAAQYHCDKHVVKMILESAQLLSTAHRISDGSLYIDSSSGRRIKRWRLSDDRESLLYKATHINHPSSVWTRTSIKNYKWLYQLFISLLDEYAHRYGKTHKCQSLVQCLRQVPYNMKTQYSTVIPLAMPDHCKSEDPVEAYRNYYLTEKSQMLKYTKRALPYWII